MQLSAGWSVNAVFLFAWCVASCRVANYNAEPYSQRSRVTHSQGSGEEPLETQVPSFHMIRDTKSASSELYNTSTEIKAGVLEVFRAHGTLFFLPSTTKCTSTEHFPQRIGPLLFLLFHRHHRSPCSSLICSHPVYNNIRCLHSHG